MTCSIYWRKTPWSASPMPLVSSFPDASKTLMIFTAFNVESQSRSSAGIACDEGDTLVGSVFGKRGYWKSFDGNPWTLLSVHRISGHLNRVICGGALLLHLPQSFLELVRVVRRRGFNLPLALLQSGSRDICGLFRGIGTFLHLREGVPRSDSSSQGTQRSKDGENYKNYLNAILILAPELFVLGCGVRGIIYGSGNEPGGFSFAHAWRIRDLSVRHRDGF
jgi:hypothetical protein